MKLKLTTPAGAGAPAPRIWAFVLLFAVTVVSVPRAGLADSAAQLNAQGKAQLAKLRRIDPAADTLATSAKAILVFPNIVKAGFLFGGQVGEGVLYKGGRPAGYFNSVAASYGLQAGYQEFGFALLFMDAGSLAEFENSAGFEIGVGPSIVLVDSGLAKTLTTTTIQNGIYAFIFDQKGLMAGLGIQGSKITRIQK